MALREEEVMHSTSIEQQTSDPDFENWFWQPLKRHQTTFIQSCEEGAAWREAGRRLQIAHRFSSHVDSKQARLAYLYERQADRSK